MVEEVSLRVGIDARPAAVGADSFRRSATEIIRSAEKMGRAVERAGGGFDKMKQAANDNSRALAGTAQSLRDVESAVNGLSRSAEQIRSLGDAVQDLGTAADDASRSLFDKFGKEIRGLTDLIIEIGVEMGVSASTMSKIVTTGEGLIATIGGIRFAGLIRDVGLLTAIFGRFAPAVISAAAAIGGFVTAIAVSPFAPFILAAGLATAGFVAFRKATEDVRDRIRSFDESLIEAKSLLHEANELSGEAAVKKRQEADSRLANAQAIAKERSALVGQKIQEQEEFITVSFGSRESNDPLKSIPGNREKKARNELQQLNALQAEQDAIAAALGEARARLPQPTKSLAGSVPGEGQAVPVFNRPNAEATSGPDGRLEIAEKLDEQRRTAEALARSFAALEERLDPLRAVTRAYGADLDLLKAAEETGLITEARQLELRGKLETATLDARDPVAALRRELEQERQQIMMTDDEREISNRLLEIEARLKTAGANVSDEIRNSLEKELVAIQKLRKGREEANDAERKADEERDKRQKDMDEDMRRRAEAVEDVFSDIRDAAKDSIKDVIKGTESIGDAFQKLADRITDILLDLALEELLSGGTGFSDVFGAILGGIGGIFGGGAPANLAGPAGFGILPIGHQGGVIGQDHFPVRRFHSGGFPGLRPDEVPIIAQRGEEVLARNDPRNAANNNASPGGNVVVNVTFPNARNTDEARQAGSEIAAKAAAAAQRGMARKGIG